MLTIYGHVANLVAKTVVNPEESAPMAPPKSTEIELALRDAESEGALAYTGPVDGFKAFEIDVLKDVTLIIPAAIALEVAYELSAMNKFEKKSPWRLVDVSQSDGYLTYELHRADTNANIGIESGELRAWIDGFLAGQKAGRAKNGGIDGMEVRHDDDPTIGELLTKPSLQEQLRLHLLALMEQESQTTGVRVGPTILAERTKATRKTVAAALQVGAYLSPDLADKLIAALGHQWLIAVTDGEKTRQIPDEDRAEVSSVALLRRIYGAHTDGLVRYVGPTDPNDALKAAEKGDAFEFAVGPTVHTVAAPDVPAWLRAVATARK
jgi:hypothetical protein